MSNIVVEQIRQDHACFAIEDDDPNGPLPCGAGFRITAGNRATVVVALAGDGISGLQKQVEDALRALALPSHKDGS